MPPTKSDPAGPGRQIDEDVSRCTHLILLDDVDNDRLTSDSEVPFKYIVFKWSSVISPRGMFGDLFHVSVNSLHGCVLGAHQAGRQAGG